MEGDERGNGMLMGTLFHVAEVLGIPYRDLLPSDEEVRAAIKARRARAKR